MVCSRTTTSQTWLWVHINCWISGQWQFYFNSVFLVFVAFSFSHFWNANFHKQVFSFLMTLNQIRHVESHSNIVTIFVCLRDCFCLFFLKKQEEYISNEVAFKFRLTFTVNHLLKYKCSAACCLCDRYSGLLFLCFLCWILSLVNKLYSCSLLVFVYAGMLFKSSAYNVQSGFPCCVGCRIISDKLSWAEWENY